MLIIDFLKWFFVPSGIVVVEETGRLSWFAAFLRLFSGAVKRDPNGPSDSNLMGYIKLGLRVKRYKCRICDVYFWGWRKRKVCYKWSCYRRGCENEG